jgi:hypothetical protein
MRPAGANLPPPAGPGRGGNFGRHIILLSLKQMLRYLTPDLNPSPRLLCCHDPQKEN